MGNTTHDLSLAVVVYIQLTLVTSLNAVVNQCPAGRVILELNGMSCLCSGEEKSLDSRSVSSVGVLYCCAAVPI